MIYQNDRRCNGASELSFQYSASQITVWFEFEYIAIWTYDNLCDDEQIQWCCGFDDSGEQSGSCGESTCGGTFRILMMEPEDRCLSERVMYNRARSRRRSRYATRSRRRSVSRGAVRVRCGWCSRWCCRHAAVAAGAGGAHPQRARAGGAVPAHLPRHHRAQAAHRRRRPQGRRVHKQKHTHPHTTHLLSKSILTESMKSIF